MPVVRVILAALGLAAAGGAALAAVHGAPVPFILFPAFFGILLTVGVLCERVFYKRLAATAPGAGWVATEERFVDPATGRLVQVHFKPETGERLYVDRGAAPPPA